MDKFISIPITPSSGEPYNARINVASVQITGGTYRLSTAANRLYTTSLMPSEADYRYFQIAYSSGEEAPDEWLSGYIADSIIAAGRLPGGESVCPPLPTAPYVIETITFVQA